MMEGRWAKVKGWPPIGWWYFKYLCEIGWLFRNKFDWGWTLYYWSLRNLCDRYKINLYGEHLH